MSRLDAYFARLQETLNGVVSILREKGQTKQLTVIPRVAYHASHGPKTSDRIQGSDLSCHEPR